VLAVLGAFIGIRRSDASARDEARIQPVHVIVAGVLCALGLILALVMLVSWITRQG
jgi:hypothetical protein